MHIRNTQIQAFYSPVPYDKISAFRFCSATAFIVAQSLQENTLNI